MSELVGLKIIRGNNMMSIVWRKWKKEEVKIYHNTIDLLTIGTTQMNLDEVEVEFDSSCVAGIVTEHREIRYCHRPTSPLFSICDKCWIAHQQRCQRTNYSINLFTHYRYLIKDGVVSSRRIQAS